MLFTKHSLIKSNLILISLSWSYIAIGSDDAYLDAMEAEAQSSDTTLNTNQDNIETDLKKTASNKKQLEFESKLSNELPTTYKSYNKLTEENKQTVISTYYETNKSMPTATRVLFSLYFKQ